MGNRPISSLRLHRFAVDEFLRRHGSCPGRRNVWGNAVPSGSHCRAAQAALAAWKDGTVTLGVRPEHLSVNASDGNAIGTAEIDVIEQLGSEIVLDTRVGDLAMTIARVDPQSPLAVGETVRLSVPGERLHFLIRKPILQFDNTDRRTGNTVRGGVLTAGAAGTIGVRDRSPVG